jgi:AsmA protein
MSSLSGNGGAKVVDGAIKGINLAEMVRNVKSAYTSTGGAQSTDFAELGGTFTIAGGVLKNNDLAMKAQLIRLKGEGEVDIGQRYVRYRVTPELVASLKGQGGKDKQGGLEVPVIIEGPFERLSYRPDLEGAAREALKDPEKAKATAKQVKEQFKEIKKNPDAVKDLLKGLR